MTTKGRWTTKKKSSGDNSRIGVSSLPFNVALERGQVLGESASVNAAGVTGGISTAADEAVFEVRGWCDWAFETTGTLPARLN
jgi:hypothetical protein